MTQMSPTIPVPTGATPRRGATQARRAAIIARDGPLCAGKGCSKPGVELDHRVPLALTGADELANWQLLCRIHHAAKTVCDLAIIAHVKRLIGRQDGSRRARKPIASPVKPWPKGRKMSGRGFEKRFEERK